MPHNTKIATMVMFLLAFIGIIGFVSTDGHFWSYIISLIFFLHALLLFTLIILIHYIRNKKCQSHNP
ncbi:hypothetical protein JD969_10295 [Planctomycetota bacterium]|nr:hypothetical protein JD969_10295 [Planctomycetota bacterium]